MTQLDNEIQYELNPLNHVMVIIHIHSKTRLQVFFIYQLYQFFSFFIVDDAMKYFLFRRRPQVGITNDYKINTKATHNHFYRYSDIRVKGTFSLNLQFSMILVFT